MQAKVRSKAQQTTTTAKTVTYQASLLSFLFLLFFFSVAGNHHLGSNIHTSHILHRHKTTAKKT